MRHREKGVYIFSETLPSSACAVFLHSSSCSPQKPYCNRLSGSTFLQSIQFYSCLYFFYQVNFIAVNKFYFAVKLILHLFPVWCYTTCSNDVCFQFLNGIICSQENVVEVIPILKFKL